MSTTSTSTTTTTTSGGGRSVQSGPDKGEASGVTVATFKDCNAVQLTKSNNGCSKTEGLSVALLGQQLPPLSKYSGNESQTEEIFQEWLAQFELVAGVYKWTPQAKLIHLTTRLRGEAFAFYLSCSKQQKSDYDLLVKELTRRFMPICMQSVKTSLFHDRKQGDQETVDSYTQDLKSRFYKAYLSKAVKQLKAWASLS